MDIYGECLNVLMHAADVDVEVGGGGGGQGLGCGLGGEVGEGGDVGVDGWI